MSNAKDNRTEWKKPQVTAITPVRRTRGGPGNIRPVENAFYATS
ncbi:hypothetical protein [Pontixanthobacter sp. CEM42]|nr:hypothetical protein [Pontixanthobacter sp. CEM42]